MKYLSPLKPVTNISYRETTMRSEYKIFSLNLPQLFLGCSFLVLGCLVYLVDRSIPTMLGLLMPDGLMHDLPRGLSFGTLNLHLPTFLHPTALILITASLVPPRRRNDLLICLSWLVINSLFEIGQHAALRASLNICGALEGHPLTAHLLGGYFRGTFDPLDLVSIFAGSVLAYILLQFTKERHDGF